jgi:hypothetical protein
VRRRFGVCQGLLWAGGELGVVSLLGDAGQGIVGENHVPPPL